MSWIFFSSVGFDSSILPNKLEIKNLCSEKGCKCGKVDQKHGLVF